MLPLFLNEGVTFDKLLRALIGVALFSSAYMAEVVRGGLQALPKGQYEGAMALGLNWGQMMRMIVLPQALKMVIPGIVNTFIGLFKDTTLVLIIGLFRLFGNNPVIVYRPHLVIAGPIAYRLRLCRHHLFHILFFNVALLHVYGAAASTQVIEVREIT